MGITILVCDGERHIRTTMKGMLADLGFRDILECGDGRKAVEIAFASFPDMAILDASLPGMDGISAALEIKNKLKIPIVLLTSDCDKATVKRALTSGVASFLTKPLRQQDLFTTIEVSLKHSEEIAKLKEKIDDLSKIIEDRKIIEKAKGFLIDMNSISESEAYRVMQKLAMDKRKTLRSVADEILKNGNDKAM